MNLGVICNLVSNKPVGVIGVDKDKGAVGYITEIKELENVIETILDVGKLSLQVEEEVDGSKIMRVDEIGVKNSHYLVAFNYHLPFPWRILGLRYVEGDLEQILKESYDYMEGVVNE
jgi:hypothetical protein